MTPLQHYAQCLRADGNLGQNISRILGTPSLNPLHTVIRESVQNITDAALLGNGPEILIGVRRLSQSQRDVLREAVFNQLPDGLRPDIEQFCGSENARVLEICDFGTSGLEGPVRADQVPENDGPTDWADFILNIGVPRNTEGGGGTYGFGKAALYKVSRSQIILVDSLLRGDTGERRFIGCHWGAPYSEGEGEQTLSYTGRHWWGKVDAGGHFIRPVTGDHAEEVSLGLGFPSRTEEQSGTSVMILDFAAGDSEDLGDAELGGQIVEYLLWSFWPRMTASCPPERRFRCTVQVNGADIAIPAPEVFPPLDLYVKALEEVRNKKGIPIKAVKTYDCSELGRLSLQKGLCASRIPLVRPEFSVIPDRSRSVALMRPVELVVKYMEGPSIDDEKVEWAGVFMTDTAPEVEQAFADAEPPAHDDWVHQHLKNKRAKSYVRKALRTIKKECAERFRSDSSPPPIDGPSPPLAKAAKTLGTILTLKGNGTNGNNGPAPSPRKATARTPQFDRLEFVGGTRVAVFTTKVVQDKNCTGKALKVKASILMEGRAMRAPDEHIQSPQVLSLTSSKTGETCDGDWVQISKDGGNEYEIRVQVPPECAVQVSAIVLKEIPK